VGEDCVRSRSFFDEGEKRRRGGGEKKIGAELYSVPSVTRKAFSERYPEHRLVPSQDIAPD